MYCIAAGGSGAASVQSVSVPAPKYPRASHARMAAAGVQLKAVQLAADHGGFVKVPFMQIEMKEQ